MKVELFWYLYVIKVFVKLRVPISSLASWHGELCVTQLSRASTPTHWDSMSPMTKNCPQDAVYASWVQLSESSATNIGLSRLSHIGSFVGSYWMICWPMSLSCSLAKLPFCVISFPTTCKKGRRLWRSSAEIYQPNVANHDFKISSAVVSCQDPSCILGKSWKYRNTGHWKIDDFYSYPFPEPKKTHVWRIPESLGKMNQKWRLGDSYDVSIRWCLGSIKATDLHRLLHA